MLFAISKQKKSFVPLLPLVLLIIILIAFAFFTNTITNSNKSGNYMVLENALDRSITQCYALEGSYPPSLSYLVENYGLTYNSEQFFIDYQYIGSNLRPDVTIIERD